METIETPKVLAVDDKRENLVTLEAMLEDKEFILHTARTGNEALELVLEHDYALILLDVQMPEMDGFETAKLIRSIEKTKHIPIIFASAISTEDKYVFEGYESGAVDFLIKPFKPEILLHKIQVFLDLDNQKRLLESQSRIINNRSIELQTILNSLMDPLITIDEAGTIQVFNPAAEKTFGYFAFEVKGRNVKILMPEPNRSQPDDYIRSYLNSGTVKVTGVGQEAKGRRKDGSEFPLELAVSEMVIEGERRFVGICRDISERKKAEESLRLSEERYELAMDASQDGLWDWDMKTGEVHFSPRWMQMLGYEPFELPGHESTFFTLLHPEDAENYGPVIRQHLEEVDWNYEFEVRLRHKDGNYRWILTRGKTVERDEEGRPVRTVGTHSDISPRKKIEQQLVQAQRQAIAANEAKGRFVANMSHEIRTPMNSILGFAHLALQTHLEPKQKNYIQKMQKSAQNLLGIINDILDFSKIEAGRLDVESVPFYIEEVLETISHQEVYRAQEQETELVFFNSPLIPSRLVGDPLRLGQVLTNLTNNSIKFTRSGTVAVYTDLVKRDDRQVLLKFVVQDTGIGMSADQLEGLFEAFTQADPSTTRKYGGTGLGLAISKNLVELMGGELQVESELGKGTTFTFVLPFECDPDETPKIHTPQEVRGMRILIMESNPILATVLKRMLKSISFNPECALSLEDGEEKLRHPGPDKSFGLILLDLNLTEMDWHGTCQRIKDNASQSDPPKIVVIAPQLENIEAITEKKNAIDAVLVKPIRLSQLFDLVMELFHGEDPAAPGNESGSTQEDTTGTPHAKNFLGLRVLVAEDNEINQEVVREMLENVGFDVQLVKDGREALERLEQEEFNLVLMDVQMPVMDGLEAARQIRKHQRFQELPVIALTANAMAGDRNRALAAGMNDHVAKPIDHREMMDTLMRWVEASSAPVKTETQAQETAETTSALPGINVEDGIKRIGGKRERYLKILKGFYQNHAKDGEHLRSAFEKDDMKTVKLGVHSLKGVAGNIGAETLYHHSQILENAIESEDEEEQRKHLDAFVNALDQVMDALKDWIDKGATLKSERNPQTSPFSLDDPKIDSLLEHLAGLLSESDSRVTEWVEALEDYLEDSPFQAEWVQLKNQVGQYQFDEAMETLQDIQNKIKRQREKGEDAQPEV